MHELTLARGIVELVEERARKEPFDRVLRVFVQVGALAHVEPRALVFGFQALSHGTCAEGATLELARIEGAAACLQCGAHFAVRARGEACPTCGGYRWVTVAGEELRVTELEVE